MLVWGHASKSIRLGTAHRAFCPTCEKERDFHDVLEYRYGHLWYLFRWVSSRSYATVCDVCGRGKTHDTKAYEAKLAKSPIPAFDRLGGAVLLLAIGLLFFLGYVADASKTSEEITLLEQPRAGDLYAIRLDLVAHEWYRDKAYGVMRVTSVTDDKVRLQVPRYGYDKASSAHRDLRRDALHDVYYDNDVVEVPRARLADMRKGGDISDVARRDP